MVEPFRHVDLCSGIGGFALGFQWAGLSEPVLFCDIEAWSRQVLAKHWPDVPIAEDVKVLAKDAGRLVPYCDFLTAGYPCQPFSQAGVRRGEEDDRHIWPEIFTIVQAKRPAWCVFENVSGHISLGLDQVLSDLADKAGYEVQTFCVGAVALDAPHRRQRIWIVGHTDDAGQPASPGPRQNNRDQPGTDTWGRSADVADAKSQRMERHRTTGKQEPQSPAGERLSGCDSAREDPSFWLPEPPVGRVANGIPRRVDRLKGLGNANVPQIAMQIGLTIKAVEHG